MENLKLLPRIIYLEDDPETKRLCATFLEMTLRIIFGEDATKDVLFSFDKAGDAENCLKLLARDTTGFNQRINIVITDWNTPKQDGAAPLVALAKAVGVKPSQILVWSADQSLDIRQKNGEEVLQGVTLFGKPTNPEEVRDWICNALNLICPLNDI